MISLFFMPTKVHHMRKVNQILKQLRKGPFTVEKTKKNKYWVRYNDGSNTLQRLIHVDHKAFHELRRFVTKQCNYNDIVFVN